MRRVLAPALAFAFVSVVSLTYFSNAAQKNGGPSVDTVQKHLGQRYPMNMPHVAGDLQFGPDVRLTEFATPAIRKADATLRFYRTTLSTGHFEYPVVEVAVAAWTEAGVLKTAECLAPTYTGESEAFIARFRGLKGKSAEEREKIAGEICEVFAGITSRSRVVGGQLIKDEYRAELWHGKAKWRTIQIHFDGAGAISAVKLSR